VQARRCRQRGTKPRQRSRIAAAIETDQFLGLFLQMIEIQSIGRPVHQTPPCMSAPTARNTGCTKALDVARKLQVGSTLPAGPGAACTARGRIWLVGAMVNVRGD